MSVVYETETPPAPRGDLGPYRRADYLALPDEPRCELLYGRLLVMTAPTLRHQRVVGNLYRRLADFADRTGRSDLPVRSDRRAGDRPRSVLARRLGLNGLAPAKREARALATA